MWISGRHSEWHRTQENFYLRLCHTGSLSSVLALLTKFSFCSLQLTRTTITGPLKYPNYLPRLHLQKIPLSFRATALVPFSINVYTRSREMRVFTGEGWYEMSVISFLHVNKTRRHETLLPMNKSHSQSTFFFKFEVEAYCQKDRKPLIVKTDS